MKKVKQEVDRSFNEVLAKAEEESKDLLKENSQLKEALKVKEGNML